MGGFADRKDAHNSKTSVIFLYKTKEDEKNKVLSKVHYNVPTMHTGDVGEYTVNDVTDWIIYTPNFTIKPGTCYLIK